MPDEGIGTGSCATREALECGMKRKTNMSFEDALALVPDDLPDGAFFAMAHELAGLEYGEGFAELAAPTEKVKCLECGKSCKGQQGLYDHQKSKHWGRL